MKDDGVYLKHVLRCITRIEEYTALRQLMRGNVTRPWRTTACQPS